MWHPIGMHFTPQVSPLGIASCWGQSVVEVPLQKQDGPFADVIAYLDNLARHMLTRKAWDELVFLSP